MSWQAPNDGPSAPATEPAAGAAQPDQGLAGVVRERGEPLLRALGEHLPGSRRHADGTAVFAFQAATTLGMGSEHSETVREAARLHDIGKLYVPADLLVRDPAGLSPEEAELIESHHDAAAGLARGAGLPSTVAAWLTTVREHFDGKGPERLADEDIPLEARIIRAACGCDALLGYAGAGADTAETRRSVVAALRASAGAELDPRVVEALAVTLET